MSTPKDDMEIVLSNLNENSSQTLQLDIVLEQGAYSFMYDYAKTDITREMAGVMLGTCEQKGQKMLVRIKAAVEARYTEAKKTSVKFTHQSWEYIHIIKDQYFPELKTIGWFHTHPGFGIFLSEFDIFIQRNFFSLPWQVAFVLDPVAKKDCFFCWQDDKIVHSNYRMEKGGLYNCGYRIETLQEDNAIAELQKYVKQRNYPRLMATGLVCLGLVGAGSYYVGIQHAKLSLLNVAQKQNLERQPQVQNTSQENNRAEKQDTDDTKQTFVQQPILQEPPEIQQDKNQTVVQQPIAQEQAVKTKTINVNKTQQTIGNVPKPAAEKVKLPSQHRISTGDTLWSISKKYYNTGRYYEKIAEFNKLADPYILVPGYVLEIPNINGSQ